MKLSELCRAIGVPCTDEQGEIEITQVTCNSKRVIPGALFVCLPGTKTHGAEFVGEAKAAGAAAVLCDREGEGVMFCHDTLAAMSVLCRKMYGCGCDRLKLIAVTGTNGKTSTVRFLESIFSASGISCGTVGTLGCYSSRRQISVSSSDVNANMTTPDPEELYPILSQMADDGDGYVFIEASSHALARKKLDGLKFEAGIFTNLTRDHLDYHKTLEEYAAAKARLPRLCKRFILNSDDGAHRLIKPEGGLTCSQKKRSADFLAECVEFYGKDGCAYRLVSKDCRFAVRSRLPGSFTVMNTLEAAACALSLGLSPLDVQNGIAALRSVSGRMERVGLSSNADISVYIDYAHTPDALENALNSIRNTAEGGRVVAVFGCGGDRDSGKRSEMGRIATRLADFTVITSDNSRSEDPEKIINDILVGVDKDADFKVIVDRRSAIEYAIKESRPDDVILIAGKGHEKYEIDVTGKHPFDESYIVRKAWLEK